MNASLPMPSAIRNRVLAASAGFALITFYFHWDDRLYLGLAKSVVNAMLVALVINAPLALSTIEVKGAFRFTQVLALISAGLAVGFVLLDLHWVVSLAALGAHLWVAREIALKPARVK